MKTCSKCLKAKPETDFYINGSRPHAHCKECIKKKASEYKEEKRAKGICLLCESPAEVGHPTCESCRKKNLDRYYRDRPQNLLTQKRRRQRYKLDAFNAYGGPFCKCCGEGHMEFLSIDHINNDGAAHRKEITNGSGKRGVGCGAAFYEWLRNNGYPPGYQVLCFNCNFAKGHFKVCPHELEKAPTLSAV